MRPHRLASSILLGISLTLPAFAHHTDEHASSWPGFRGPHGTAAVASDGKFGVGAGSLAAAWRAPLGPGYSEVAVADGLAVTLHSDGTEDWLVAVDAATGASRWRYKIGATYKGHDGSHDGPIASPAVARGTVVGFGPGGELFALDAATGGERWRVATATAHGAKAPFYGFSASPLVVGATVVVEIGAPEGKAMAGFDLATGALRWTAGEDEVEYQSPIPFEVAGRHHVVATGNQKIFGLDPATGKVLWEHAFEGNQAAMGAPSLVPVPAGEGRLFLKHKGDASRMVRVVAEGESFRVEPLWTAPVLRGTYAVPVYHQGLLFGFTGRILSAVDAATGEILWRSREPGDGFLSLVGDLLVVQAKAGSVHVAPASREGWREVARWESTEVSWTAPAFAAGSVFVRSMAALTRLDWRAGSAAPSAVTAAASGSAFDRFLADVASASDKKAAVDRFLAAAGTLPLIEWPDRVIFLYRGEAKDMGITGEMLGARREEPMTRVADTDLFYFESRIEPDARLAYRFVKDFDQRLADPGNPRKQAEDDGSELSWFAMPAWRAPEHLGEAAAEQRGRIEEHEVQSKVRPDFKVKLSVYLPAGYDTGTTSHAVAYHFDGAKARNSGQLDRTLDHLIAAGRIEALAVVFVEPVDLGPATTPAEWEAQLETSARIVAEDVVAFVEGRYRARSERQARALLGSGFAAYFALEVLMRHPGVFGSFGGQSVFLFESGLPELVARLPKATEHPARLYLDWGSYDMRAVREGWNVGAANRLLVGALRERGYRPAGGEVNEGHGWPSFKNRSDRLLEALFGKGGL
ncbi:MAG TPA: PQQ-binding-like beta-propeller repeat protein [Thermoanaerobaculia bacterium]|nr:PQQ-binding-like beta-propeller repeat protein [Thermoanaerobaculia bacterium]